MDTIKIYITYTNPIWREGIKAIIDSQQDMEIIGETLVSDELSVLLKKKRPDVLLLDPGLFGLNSVEILTSIKDSSLETRIIFLIGVNAKKNLKYLSRFNPRMLFYIDEPLEILFRMIRSKNWGEITPNSMFDEGTNFRMGVGCKSRQDCPLSSRGIETLQLIEQGLTKKEMAQVMGVSYKTICYHVEKIMRKLNVHKCLEAVIVGIDNQWIQSSPHPAQKAMFFSKPRY